MDNKKLVYNNEQYNILTNINIGTTTFLICIDIFDKKLQYFKQEVINGKIKLTSQVNLISTAQEVNKKSITNKKRILDAFIVSLQKKLLTSVFVDRNKVANLFKELSKDIEECDLKYYIIDNASIEETDESIEKLISKYENVDINKNLDKVNQMQNELYYYNTNQDEPVKEKEVSNFNKIEVTKATGDNLKGNNGPIIALDPFKDGNINMEKVTADLTQTQVIENILTQNLNKTTINIPSSNSIENLVNKNAQTFEDTKKEEKQSPKKKRRDKSKMFIGLVIVTLIIAIVGIYILFKKDDKKYNNREIMEQVLDITTITESNAGVAYNEPENPTKNYSKIMKNKLIDVSFDELLDTNSDTTAWINIPYLDVDYPVVKNDEYYQTHNYYHDENESGWIHSDSNFKKLGKNTVIYGKTTNDKTLFTNLKNALNKDITKDANNQIIKMSTQEENTLWQIFAVYEIKNEEYYMTEEFKTDEDFLSFLSEMKVRSIYDFNVELNELDKVLTLSTNKDNNNRIIVQAKLVKIENKEED